MSNKFASQKCVKCGRPGNWYHCPKCMAEIKKKYREQMQKLNQKKEG